MDINLGLQPKQQLFWQALLDNSVTDIVFGGAKKGGKSWIVRRASVFRRMAYPGSVGLILRETMDEVIGNHCEQIKNVAHEWGVEWKYNVNDSIFTFPQFKHGVTPSTIILGYGKTVEHTRRYEGNTYLDICPDEATNIPKEVLLRIHGQLASTDWPMTVPKFCCTCNPGGVTTEYILRTYVEPGTRKPGSVFIQSLVDDNPAFLSSDPGFKDRLAEAYKDEPWILEQWLRGNWYASPNSYFAFDNEVGGKHVKELVVPYWAKWYAGIDEGYWPDPFAVGWAAKWQDRNKGHHIHFVCDVGAFRKEYDEQAGLVLETEKTIPGLPPRFVRYCDPQTNERVRGQKKEGENRTGATITARDLWRKSGMVTTPAKKLSRQSGWMLVRYLLKHGILTFSPDCHGIRQEIVAAQYEKNNMGVLTGDLDDKTGDHFLDLVRYVCVETFGLTFMKDHKSVWQEHAENEAKARELTTV
jgi:hypothetical protein